jgi:ribosomal silencing factor RsfS
VHHEFRDFVFYAAFATDAKQLAEEILKQAKALADNIISVEQLAEGNWSLNAAAQGQFVPF